MDLSTSDILYIVNCDQEREVWTTIGYSFAALMAFAALVWFVLRPAVINIIEKVRRVGFVHAAIAIGLLVIPAIIYGGSKKTAITNFTPNDYADHITFVWSEDPETAILSIQIQRRLKGATEEEAWENCGSAVPGGQRYVTIPGFTIDKDWEYRAVYIFMQY